MENEMKRELSFYPDAELLIKIAEDNSNTQVEQIKELVASGIDILMISPYESTPLTPIVEEVYHSGIPVILIDRELDSDQYTGYVGADNYQIGKTACHYIANKLNGKGKILEIQGSMASSIAKFRSSGFRDALKNYPGMKIVATVNSKTPHQTIIDSIDDHPDINIVYGHNDLLAESVYKIIRERENTSSIFFLGIDGLAGKNGGIQLVEDGILNATLLYPTGGTESIQLAMAIYNNLPVNKRNTLQSAVVDKENARIINLQMEKVMSLQESISEQLLFKSKIQNTYKNQKIFISILILSLFLTFLFAAILWSSLNAKKQINKTLELKNQQADKQQQKLLEMSQQINKANQIQTDFFTNISHEFKTPLSLILGFADDLLPSPKINKQVYHDISLIKENANRILRLVNQLMDFRKIENEGMKIKVTENDLVAFLKSVLNSFQPMAHKRNIKLNLYTRYESLMTWFDADGLDKVLFNLLSNAFKFTEDGGLISVYISKDKLEDRVKIKVEDNGAGMNRETLNHIFEPFYQGEGKQKQGTGLGLPLSQKLVKLHHGEITVSSIKGKGSRFTVNLPLGVGNFKEGEMDITSSNEFVVEEVTSENEKDLFPIVSLNPDSHEHTLLIVEDNVEMRSFLERKLAETYTIVMALDGETGIQKAFEIIPDLIVSDVNLPGMDGLELTKTLKSDIRTSHIPIVLLTAYNSPEQQLAGIKTGADAYISKPFSFIFLKEQIKNLLINRQILKEIFNQEILHFKEKDHHNVIDEAFLNNFMAYVENNYYRENLNVLDLCEELKLSRSQLYRKVKALLGISISDYIQNIRMKKAEEYLLNHELTVSELAYKVGYSSPAYFSTVFKAKHGEGPGDFRNKHFYGLSN